MVVVCELYSQINISPDLAKVNETIFEECCWSKACCMLGVLVMHMSLIAVLLWRPRKYHVKMRLLCRSLESKARLKSSFSDGAALNVPGTSRNSSVLSQGKRSFGHVVKRPQLSVYQTLCCILTLLLAFLHVC